MVLKKIARPIGISTNADTIDGSMPSLKEELAAVSASGAEYGEIILHSLDVIVNGEVELNRLREVKEICALFPLKYTMHLPFVLNILDPARGDIHYRVFESSLEVASELTCPLVVYHASHASLDPASVEKFYRGGFGSEDPDLIRQGLLLMDAEKLSLLADRASALGVAIAVENPNGAESPPSVAYGTDPAGLRDQIKRVGRKNLGVTIDFGHLYIQSKILGYDYLEAVRTLAPLAIHAHVHDNFGKSDRGEPYIQRLPYGLGDLHLPPGTGSVPIDPTLQILTQANYQGIYMLEIEFRFWPYFADHVASFKRRFDDPVS